MLIKEPITACLKCQGDVWDNRGNKKNPKSPDFKCKDKDGCGEGFWFEKPKGNGKGKPAAAPEPAAPVDHRDGLALIAAQYRAAWEIAAHIATKEKTTADGEDRRTVFIEIARRRIDPRLAVKPKPTPKPEPEEEADDDFLN